jgi:hypothetical protein
MYEIVRYTYILVHYVFNYNSSIMLYMYLFIVVAIADRRRLHLLWGDAGDAVWDMLSHPALELLFRNPIPQDFASTSAI